MALDLSALSARLDFERRTLPETGFVREEASAPGAALVRHWPSAGAGGAHGFVSWSALDPEQFDDAIGTEVTRYRGCGLSFEWKLFDHDQPTPERHAALAAALGRHGFSPGEWEAALVAPAVALAGALAETVPPEGIAFRRLADPDGLAPLDEIQAAVWGAEAHAHWLPSRDLGAELRAAPDRLAIFLAETADADEARSVSAAWIRFNPESAFAGLWGGSTHPGFRQRGIYRTLLALRAREAMARGCETLYVDATPDSRPILERLGFALLTGSRPWVWSPP
jgi:hypothetical protein